MTALTIFEIVIGSFSVILILLMLYNVVLKIRNIDFWYLNPKIEITNYIISLSAAALTLANFIGALVFQEREFSIYGFIWLTISIWQVNM